MNALVIVADASRARIFRTRQALKKLFEQEDIIHTESRLRNGELYTDSPGRASKPGHGQGSAMEPRTTPKQHEEETFAKDLGRHIKQLYNNDPFEELILIAAPRFLGQLRSGLPAPVNKLETRSIDKELINLPTNELIEHIWNR